MRNSSRVTPGGCAGRGNEPGEGEAVTEAQQVTDDVKLMIASAYISATEANDAVALKALHDKSAVVWHNFDEKEVPGDESAKTLAWLFRSAPDVRFTEQHVRTTSDGFVLQWTVTGTGSNGQSLRAPSCLVVSLSPAGFITRVQEYLDPSALSGLR